MAKSVAIYNDNGVMVVDFTRPHYKQCEVVSFELKDRELTISYIRKRWIYVDHNPTLDYFMSDVDPYDQEYISQALPQYVETIKERKRVKVGRLGIFREWKTSEAQRLKEGFVELNPDPVKTVVTTSYRIIN